MPTICAQAEHIGVCEPILLHTTHGGREHSVSDPVPTVTGANRGELALVQPFLCSWKEGIDRRTHDINDPLPTQTASNQFGVVQPFLAQLSQSSSNGSRVRSVDAPAPTITTADDLAFVVPVNYGERPGQTPRTHDVAEPLPTVVGNPTHALVQPYLVNYNRTGRAHDINDPLNTVTATDRFGLVVPCHLDILFRMLQATELAAAMSFPAGYKFAGKRKADVIRQIGNAVPTRLARALCLALLAA